MIARISDGVIEPSDRAVPAFTKSFSWTKICFDKLTKYFLTSPPLDSTITSRLPLLILPKEIIPSISDTTAGLEGLRASNNSVTLGRPPVISAVPPATLGILTKISPPVTLSPSFTIICAPTGKLYVLKTFFLPSTTVKTGIFFLSLISEITFSVNPVCSSASSL